MTSKSRKEPDPSSSGPTILVVDDDEDSRIIFALSLKNAGYTVITAIDGAEGVRCAQVHQPALILMDIAMPVMDGLRAIETLKADPGCCTIPVVVLTSAASNHDIVALRDRGFARVEFKPITPDRLVALADSVVPLRQPAG